MEPYTKGNIDQLSFSTHGKYEDIYMFLFFFFQNSGEGNIEVGQDILRKVKLTCVGEAASG